MAVRPIKPYAATQLLLDSEGASRTPAPGVEPTKNPHCCGFPDASEACLGRPSGGDMVEQRRIELAV